MQEIDFESARQTNVIKLGTVELEALGHRIIVVRDEFRSGYECPTCQGKGSIVCDGCGGNGKSLVAMNARCARCQGQKTVVCPECKGREIMDGGLYVPERAENRPTTGTVASVGELVDPKILKVGDGVMFPSYCGVEIDLTAYDLNNEEIPIAMVILSDNEVQTKIKGHLELRRVKRKAAVGTAM